MALAVNRETLGAAVLAIRCFELRLLKVAYVSIGRGWVLVEGCGLYDRIGGGPGDGDREKSELGDGGASHI